MLPRSSHEDSGLTRERCKLLLSSLSAAVLIVLGSCASPSEYVQDADQEVYSLLDERRAELFASEGGFQLGVSADSVRQQILAGTYDASVPLSLTDCLEIAAENSREAQTQRESLYLAALDLTLERWAFQNRPFAGLDGVAAGVGDDSADASVDGSAGFTRLLGNGASIVTSLGSSLFRVISTGDGWDAVSDLSLAFTQPLMRGAGRQIALEPLTQAERDLVYQVRSYERFRRNFAVTVAQRVYDLLQAIDELQNEEENYKNLVRLRERNEALAEAGRLSDIQADQARQDELRSENRLISLRASLERSRDQFNLFLGLPIDFHLSLDPSEFTRLTEVDPWIDNMNAAAAPDFALMRRLDHMTVRDRVQDRERAVVIAEDALRAGLQLAASASAGGVDSASLNDLRFEDTAWSTSLCTA